MLSSYQVVEAMQVGKAHYVLGLSGLPKPTPYGMLSCHGLAIGDALNSICEGNGVADSRSRGTFILHRIVIDSS